MNVALADAWVPSYKNSSKSWSLNENKKINKMNI